MTEIVIAGSRKVDPELVLWSGLQDFIWRRVAPLSSIRLRCGVATLPGPLERAVAEVCEDTGIPQTWWIPDVRLQTGRKAVWYRDTEMIATADLVLCYYLEEQDDDSGTVGLVDKAMAMGVPVYAYGQRTDELSLPEIIRVGEHDELNLWGDRVPGAAILAG